MSMIKCVIHPEKGDRCKQAPAAETDINLIVRRYLKTGQLPSSVRSTPPSYADVSGSVDLQTLMAKARYAANLFSSLPDSVRSIFKTPQVFFEYMAQHPELLKPLEAAPAAVSVPAAGTEQVVSVVPPKTGESKVGG
nr:MAG: internal scaffolding protein [Microviridae sp.]